MPEPHPVMAELLARRLEDGLTRTAVARQVGYVPASVRICEAGQVKVTVPFASRYADVVGLCLILGGEPVTAARFREARLDAGLLAKDVAKRLGCSKAALHRWEAGTNAMPLGMASTYANLLGLELRLVEVADA
jgi:DNA-binding XRE family transcriptional regulator